MTVPHSKIWIVLMLLGTAVPAYAQTGTDGDVAAVRTDYEFGKYDQAIRRAMDRIDRGGLSEGDLIELHKYAALSAFSLDHKEEAERHFTALLRINPDYALDPFVVPPPTLAFYDGLRKRLGPSLEPFRVQRVERQKAEEEARRREQQEAERRRIEEMTRRSTLTTVQQRSFLVNFVPLGAGQFQQGRSTWGSIFGVTEGLLVVGNIASYFAYAGLLRQQSVDIDIGPNQKKTINIVGIPMSQQRERDNWRTTQLVTGIGFYSVYLIGVIDAVLHHQDQVITTRTESPVSQRSPRTVSPFVFSSDQGTGAGLTLSLP